MSAILEAAIKRVTETVNGNFYCKYVLARFVRVLQNPGSGFLRDWHFRRALARIEATGKALPKCLHIETTSICNARCIMCAYPVMQRSKGVMDMGLFQKIVDDAAALGIGLVNLQFYGEPFVDKHLAERIRRIKSKGMRVRLNTNASLMTEEKALAAMEAGLDELNISFDGFSKETYEKIRVGLKYDEVMANIQSLLRLKKSRGSRNPLVRMTFVLFQENEKEAKAFFDHWRREVDDVVISYARDWAGQMKVESKSSPHLSASVPEKNPCDSLWQDMVVGYDGQVVLCCNDYDGKVSMGDLTRQTVSEVWFGDKFERYRSAQKGGSRKNLELCEGCSKFSFWE